MSEASALVPSGLDRVSTALTRQGFALTDEKEIGLPEKFRENFTQAYFNERVLRHDEGDRPADRQRARDVVQYQWDAGQLRLTEHDRITITERAGIPGKRDHARVMLLSDPQAGELIRTFLAFVPQDRRHRKGTFGINLFRTFTNVVTAPHRDHEEFIFLYVLDMVGGGAESYFYRTADVSADGRPTAEPIFRKQLHPGQILIFDDEIFLHGATPLERARGVWPRRDALVCTVDYPSTYL